MVAYFVDSNAVGAGTGADWANAYTTIALALARPILAGDTLWVGDDHNESTASSVTWTFPGTQANPNFVYCVDHTKASPGANDLKTTAIAATTGNSNISQAGSVYFYGLTINCGTGNNSGNLTIGNTSGSMVVMDSCALAKLGTSANVAILFAPNTSGIPGLVILRNTTMAFGVAGDTVSVRGCKLLWQNTPSAILGTAPTNLFTTSNFFGIAILEGVDLSALGSGHAISQANMIGTLYLKDCKLGASVTVAGTPANEGPAVYVTRSDSSGTNYIEQVYKYTGTQVDETTIVRTGGATDGTTPKSRKITTTANSKWVLPFESNPMAIWVDKVTPVTVTVFGTWNQAAVPNTDDIWIDVEYLGASTSPLGSFINSTKANNLAAGVALTADGSTWGGGGSGAGWSPFAMSVTFTPAQKGVVYITPKAAKATSTFYVDPAPVLS